MPYTPVTFGIFAGYDRGDLFDPVRTTPMHAWAVQQGAVFEDVGQWKRARYFPQPGEDMHAAVDARMPGGARGVGMFDASTLGKIEVVGPDAADVPEAHVRQRFRERSRSGRCRYGIMLREDGFIFDDGVVGRLARGPLPCHDHHRRRGARASR